MVGSKLCWLRFANCPTTPATTARTSARPARSAPSCLSSIPEPLRSVRRWRRDFAPTFLRPKPNTSPRRPEPSRMTCAARRLARQALRMMVKEITPAQPRRFHATAWCPRQYRCELPRGERIRVRSDPQIKLKRRTSCHQELVQLRTSRRSVEKVPARNSSRPTGTSVGYAALTQPSPRRVGCRSRTWCSASLPASCSWSGYVRCSSSRRAPTIISFLTNSRSSSLRDGQVPDVSTGKLRLVSAVIHGELLALAVVLVCAAIVARGEGCEGLLRPLTAARHPSSRAGCRI